MSSRRTEPGVGRVYDSAAAWVEHALRQDSSLFTPGVPIWSSHWLAELRRRFWENPDNVGSGFLDRLREQLVGSPPEVFQLMGELLYFHLLIPNNRAISSKTKQNHIERVLTGAPSVVIPPALVAGLAPGIINPGRIYTGDREFQFGYLIEFVQQWKEQDAEEQDRLLADPWGFKNFATEIKFRSSLMQRGGGVSSAQREALLHLVFPDTFEGIVSIRHKETIADRFAELIMDEPADDIDRRLAQIRPAFEANYGVEDSSYYRNDVRVEWDPNFVPLLPTDLEELADELLWDAGELEKIFDGLEDKRQVIFQGPPGTGKTYAARRIADWYCGQDGDYRIVQFHPSYAYEDFIQGFRPTLTDDGQAGFTLTDGPLLQMAKQAEANPDATYILIIDEINRGNVSKTLGELYFLLEYRDEEITLQYSSESFRLPKNLWFIGTMNTTDRSIALVDAALRRRFYFFNFFPDQPPVQGLLRRWLRRENPDAEWVADLVDLANGQLNDRQLGIGPSYFMREDLYEYWARFIWEQSVLPYIAEHFFGEEDRLKEFAYDELQSKLNVQRPTPDAGDRIEADDGDATA